MRAHVFICIILFAMLSSSLGSKAELEKSDALEPCYLRRLWGLRNLVDLGGHIQGNSATAFLHRPCNNLSRNREQIKNVLSQGYVPIAAPAPRARIGNDAVNEKYEEPEKSNEDLLSRKGKDEWIDGQQMMKILESEKINKQRLQQESIRSKINKQATPAFDAETMKFASRITYTDANTLQIEIPPAGVDSNVFFSGAFSAMWFSAIAPATISMVGGGLVPLLFMTPFWLAGGMVAKLAVYDPFVSSTLSIGKYAWALEKRIFRKLGSLTSKKREGATEFLKGASVNLALVVNNVPKYELLLYYVDGEQRDGKSVSFGKGLSLKELEYISGVINDHCATFRLK